MQETKRELNGNQRETKRLRSTTLRGGYCIKKSSSRGYLCTLSALRQGFCKNITTVSVWQLPCNFFAFPLTGVKILSAMENIPHTPEGTLLESLLEGINQYYSEELSQKTKRGMNEKRLTGNFIGGNINFGYSLKPVFSEINGKQIQTAQKVIVNEEEAPIVNRIFTEYAGGKKAVDIARDLRASGIKNRKNVFTAPSIYHILRQEKYTGIYCIHGMTFPNIYPPIVPLEVFEIVKTRIETNKYGKHPTSDVNYLLKGKIYCGFCGRRMTSFTGTSKSGKISRYYKCHKTYPCEQSKTIKKEVLENAVSAALKNLISTENNFSLLLNKIIELHNESLHDLTALKILEKELISVEKSLSNLLTAIEAGMLTDTTKDRLLELETRKRELKANIATEKTKDIKPLDKNKITQYLLYALSQPTAAMIDLLVQRVIMKNETVELYLKYSPDTPPNQPPPDKPKRGRPRQSEHPERIISERGVLFNEYIYTFETDACGRKAFGMKKHKTKIISINVLIMLN